MKPIEELHRDICRQIGEAHARLMKDVERLRERYQNDFMRSDFERRVRWAQYTVETADLERERMMLVRNMATMTAAKPIAGVNLDVN